MQRRIFAAGVAALSAASLLGPPTRAQEATPEATPEGSGEYVLTTEGLLVSAKRWFHTGSVRMDGGMVYDFVAYVYDSHDHAQEAFAESDGFFGFGLENMERQGGSLSERSELSVPELGDERIGEMFKYTTPNDVTAKGTIFRAYEGNVFHLWLGTGIVDPSVELLELAEQYMSFGDVDADDDEDVLSLLPDLQDMPPGFTQTGEEVIRDNGGTT